jgi:hypothetical protein
MLWDLGTRWHQFSKATIGSTIYSANYHSARGVVENECYDNLVASYYHTASGILGVGTLLAPIVKLGSKNSHGNERQGLIYI